jgi:hypothetical protein
VSGTTTVLAMIDVGLAITALLAVITMLASLLRQHQGSAARGEPGAGVQATKDGRNHHRRKK